MTTDTAEGAGKRVEDGGPASGMSIRDCFAAAALAGLSHDMLPDRAAKHAYIYADAMLRARSEGGK